MSNHDELSVLGNYRVFTLKRKTSKEVLLLPM